MGFFEEIEQSTMLPRKLYKGRKSSMKKSRYVDFIEALCPNSSKNPRKFFGSAGYPNFQPIKKRSIARQRSIVVGAPLFPKDLHSALQIYLQNNPPFNLHPD